MRLNVLLCVLDQPIDVVVGPALSDDFGPRELPRLGDPVIGVGRLNGDRYALVGWDATASEFGGDLAGGAGDELRFFQLCHHRALPNTVGGVTMPSVTAASGRHPPKMDRRVLVSLDGSVFKHKRALDHGGTHFALPPTARCSCRSHLMNLCQIGQSSPDAVGIETLSASGTTR